ncbi:22926_t:CDS:2 [Entrophospora sp. SA101]|nr:22926_t:CDS:2 [Entrophospora sp. SA101]
MSKETKNIRANVSEEAVSILKRESQSSFATVLEEKKTKGF